MVRPGKLAVIVKEKGNLESAANKDVHCEVEGGTTIIRILPEGTRVKEGDVVCELDSASLKDSLNNQKISTQQAEASFKQAFLTREVAEYAVKEYVEGVFKQDKATIEGQIALAKSDLERAIDRVEWSDKVKQAGLRLDSRPEHRRPPLQGPVDLRARAEPDQARRPPEVHQGEDDQGAGQRRPEGQGRRAVQAVDLRAWRRPRRRSSSADQGVHPQGPRRRDRGLRQRAGSDGSASRPSRSRKAPRSASARRSSACPTPARCGSTPRSTSRWSTGSSRASGPWSGSTPRPTSSSGARSPAWPRWPTPGAG